MSALRWGIAILILLGAAYALLASRDLGSAAPGAGSADAEQAGAREPPLLRAGDGTDPRALDGETTRATADEATPSGRHAIQLAVRVVEEDGEAAVGIEVLVRPGQAGADRLRAQTDSNGSAILAIPRSRFPVTLLVLDGEWHVGTEVARGPTAEVEITIPRSFYSRVRVRDHLGAAVVGAEVRFKQSSAVSEGTPPTAFQVTDERGVAVLPARLRPSIVGHLHIVPPKGREEAFERLHIRHWIVQEVAEEAVVRLGRVSGRVILPDEATPPRASVLVGMPGSRLTRRYEADANGRFEIRARVGVAIDLVAAVGTSTGPPPGASPVRVVPPREDLELELQSGARLHVILDGMRDSVVYTCELIAEPGRVEQMLRVPASKFWLDIADPDRAYSLWIVGSDGEYSHARKLSGSAGEIRLALQKGEELEVTFETPADCRVRDVWIFDSGIHVRGTRRGERKYVLQSVPPGTYRVGVLLISRTDTQTIELTTDEIRSAKGPIRLSLEVGGGASK